MLKWTATMLSVLIVGLWFASRWIWFQCVYTPSHACAATIQSGRLWMLYRQSPASGVGPIRVHLMTTQGTQTDPEWRMWFDWGQAPPGNWAYCWVYIPLWLLFPVAAVPAAVLWRRSMRLVDGVCSRCGYDRTGLREDALCPECGDPGPTITPAASRGSASLPATPRS